jgi:hypothetical protein
MAKTKHIFPNISKIPQDSGSSFLPIYSCIGRVLTGLYSSPKKNIPSFKKNNPKNSTKQWG